MLKLLQVLQHYLQIRDNDKELIPAGAVKQFIMSLPFNKKYPNTVSPDGEGGLTLKWSLDQVQQDKKLILTFEPGLIHMAYKSVVGEPVYEDDIVYSLEDICIPQKIITYIPSL